MNTHNLTIEFGRHKGERWTRLPVNYLKWLINEPTMADEVKSIARSELKRRGTSTPSLDISGHAIDRASIFLRGKWLDTRKDDEGLHSWLSRVSSEALIDGERLDTGKIKYEGMKFVFAEDGAWPVLKTITPA